MTARRSARPDAAPDSVSPPICFDAAWLTVRLQQLVGPLSGRHVCLAYSGGMDSYALLCALAAARRRGRFRLRALHVDHRLQPGSADWARAASATARRLKVSCRVLSIRIARGAGESIEAAARAARYQALVGELRAGELLLTAHHQEDQLETILLALMRGSGVRGLSAMAAVTRVAGAQLVRPLLPVSRAQLQDYLKGRRIAWNDDPSNRDLRFDRNYLRHAVIPRLTQRWPAAAASAGRSASHLLEARALLERLAARALRDARDGAALCISTLRRLPDAERRNALRYWIAQQGLPLPDLNRLRELAGPVLAARADATPQVRWRGACVRRHGDRLYAFAGEDAGERAGEGAGEGAREPPAGHSGRPLSWDWQAQPWLSLPGRGSLGIVQDRHGDLNLSVMPSRLSVSFRRGGERLQTSQGHRALKDLLQQQDVVPWNRPGVPLVLHAGRIVAVADLWIDPRYRAPSATAGARGRLRWRR